MIKVPLIKGTDQTIPVAQIWEGIDDVRSTIDCLCYAKSEQADMPAAEITEIVLEYERRAVEYRQYT